VKNVPENKRVVVDPSDIPIFPMAARSSDNDNYLWFGKDDTDAE
jgi:hypothetical protein